jgi:hypothetical protein
VMCIMEAIATRPIRPASRHLRRLSRRDLWTSSGGLAWLELPRQFEFRVHGFRKAHDRNRLVGISMSLRFCLNLEGSEMNRRHMIGTIAGTFLSVFESQLSSSFVRRDPRGASWHGRRSQSKGLSGGACQHDRSGRCSLRG